MLPDPLPALRRRIEAALGLHELGGERGVLTIRLDEGSDVWAGTVTGKVAVTVTVTVTSKRTVIVDAWIGGL